MKFFNDKTISSWYNEQINMILNEHILNKKFDNLMIYTENNDRDNIYFKEHV